MKSTVPLRRVTRMAYGDSLASEARVDGDYPVVGSGGVSGSHNAHNFGAPGIVVGRKGSYGSVHWVPTGGFAIDTAYYIDERLTSSNLRWLYYVLQAVDLRSPSQDVGVPGLSREAAYGVSVPTPPPAEEQRRIADFLDVETARIDHLTAKLHRQSQLVTEREESSIPIGVAGALLHTAKVRTGLPWMPFMNPDAQVIPLLRVLQLQRGVDLTDDQRIDGPVPVVTTAGLSGWHNQAIAEGPGVVIRRYGSRGNVHWVDSDYWPHNTTLYVKNFNGNSRRYCYHLLRALPYEMEQVKAAIPGVNRNDLHRLKVAIVPQALQESVAEAMDSDMAKFQVERERIQRIRQLLAERRQALITAAVTGQFDVTTASGRNVTDGVSA